MNKNINEPYIYTHTPVFHSLPQWRSVYVPLFLLFPSQSEWYSCKRRCWYALHQMQEQCATHTHTHTHRMQRTVLLRHDPTDVEHAEWRAAGGTRTSTTQPRFWLTLILATGKPATHAFETPHRSTLAVATRWRRVCVVSTTPRQLDAGHSLHAADARVQQLHAVQHCWVIYYYRRSNAITNWSSTKMAKHRITQTTP